MKVARYEVPGIGKKIGPRPAGTVEIALRGKTMCAEFHACPESDVPPGREPFFLCYPGNKLPGYYREVPPGQEAYPAS